VHCSYTQKHSFQVPAVPLQFPLERSSSQLAEAPRQLDASQAGSRVTDPVLLKAQLWGRASYCKLIPHLKQALFIQLSQQSLQIWGMRSCLLDEHAKHDRVLSALYGRQARYLMICWAVKRDTLLVDICQLFMHRMDPIKKCKINK